MVNRKKKPKPKPSDRATGYGSGVRFAAGKFAQVAAVAKALSGSARVGSVSSSLPGQAKAPPSPVEVADLLSSKQDLDLNLPARGDSSFSK